MYTFAAKFLLIAAGALAVALPFPWGALIGIALLHIGGRLWLKSLDALLDAIKVHGRRKAPAGSNS